MIFDEVILDDLDDEFEPLPGELKRDGDHVDDTEINESELKIPAGMAPEGMKSSHIRMVQLFYNEETEPLFRYRVKMLAQKFNTDNISDTVYLAIQNIAEEMGIREDEQSI